MLATYRYLRMAMVTVLALLAAAVILEILRPSEHANPNYRTDESVLTSISAYYWTGVGPVFIASLVALGVGMVILKPESEIEDLLLNLAGVLAPIVAFVPTVLPKLCDENGVCTKQPFPDSVTDSINNNMVALAAAGVVALGLFVGIARHHQTEDGPEPREKDGKKKIWRVRALGLCLVGGAWAGLYVWYLVDDEDSSRFEDWAHLSAAIPLFVCIVLVVIINAGTKMFENRQFRKWNSPEEADSVTAGVYAALAIIMVLSAAVAFFSRNAWDHSMMFVEVAVLVCFIVFWAFQTAELWNRGVRRVGDGPQVWPFTLEQWRAASADEAGSPQSGPP